MATTTKESLQARRFMNRRLRAALLEGDAESGRAPLARLGTGSYAGIFVTIALLAIVGVIGVLRPGGSTAWQRPGAFIVASETGTRYVLLGGLLHPVLNYSSAKLLLGNQLHVVTASARSLESSPRGPTIGIPLAPDSLPDAAHIVGTSWSVCAIGTATDDQPLRTAVVPGRLSAGTPVAADDAYLARTGTFYHQSMYPILRGCRATVAAENLARGNVSVARFITAWMLSPGHRANVLDGRLTRVAVSAVYARGQWTVTADFARY